MTSLRIVGLLLFAAAAPPIAVLAQDQNSCSAAPTVAVPFASHLADSSRLFRGHLSPDGKEFYYFKKETPGQEDYRIYVSRLRGEQWSAPERMLIAGEYSELYPTISSDGKRLVFSSYQPVPGDTSAHPNAHIYVADWKGDGWGEPRLQRAASRIGWYHSGPMFGPGDALYFTVSSRDSAISMKSRWNGREFEAPTPYADAERWRGWGKDIRVWGAQPVAGDSILLVQISARRPDGRSGPPDMYASFRRGGGWTDPRPLGAGVNTEGAEGFASVSPNGCELIFTRNYTSFYHVSWQAALADARKGY
jgi:hypothetical protein